MPHAYEAQGCGATFWIIYLNERTVHSVLPQMIPDKIFNNMGAAAFYIYFAQRWFLPRGTDISATALIWTDVIAGVRPLALRPHSDPCRHPMLSVSRAFDGCRPPRLFDNLACVLLSSLQPCCILISRLFWAA